MAANADLTPDTPGALYLRPTLLGTDVTIGAAAAPSASAILYVLACPVGEYLPPRPLTVAVETVTPRTTPQFGVVKAGANYAMALSPITTAKERFGADQVLFAPDGTVQETGASNVLLLDGDEVLTPALSDAYLHGVTRDSLLRVAASLGWRVSEREVTVADCRRVDRPARCRAGAHRDRRGGGVCRDARRRRHGAARRHAAGHDGEHRSAARRAPRHPDRPRRVRLVAHPSIPCRPSTGCGLARHPYSDAASLGRAAAPGSTGSGRSGFGGTTGSGFVGAG